jgi:hypothetical protein
VRDLKYKAILLIVLLAFAISLAVVVGQRLSSEAMAVIIGVVAGVAASIPTSLIVVWVALRVRGDGGEVVVERPAPEPKIVVVAPPAAAHSYAPQAGPSYLPQADPRLTPRLPLGQQAYGRHFTVIGGAGEEEL